MFFGKKDKSFQTMPPWLKWSAALFIVYVLVMGHKNPPDTPQDNAPIAPMEYDWEKVTRYSQYKDRFLPAYTTPMRIKDVEPGTGMPAVCGQQVTVAYQSFLEDDQPAPDTAEALVFKIGNGDSVFPALDEGVIGMQPGGKRSLVAPAKMAYGKTHFATTGLKEEALVRFEVQLLEVNPALPAPGDTPYRITDMSGGQGAAFACGQPAKVHITVWGVDGEKLYSTQGEGREPLSFVPGKSEMFLGLEQAVVGMAGGGTRLLVVPPSFQRTMYGNKPLMDIPFPKQQTVLVDVEAVQ